MRAAAETEAAKPAAIFVMGPTAAGKTALAVDLVQRFAADIISVDSALVYRGMDIGTAKPDAATLALAPHRLIDILDPDQAYSAARFREDALREMADIVAAGRTPLLVGGTMLYFRALQQGLAQLPQADPGVRAELDRQMQAEGLAALHRRLAEIDPESAARIHPNDPQRTLRALEVYEVSGRSLTELRAEQVSEPFPYRRLKLVCAPASRDLLRERVAIRFASMLEDGLVEEVTALLKAGVARDSPAMRSVGYRQVANHLSGECDRSEMQEQAVAATRQLAKRQMTWLRSEADCHWLAPENPDQIAEALKLVELHLI